jgi:hypothetical protein
MQHLRSKASIQFLILVFLTGLIGGILLSSRTAWSQGPPILTDDFNDNSLDTAKWNPDSPSVVTSI